MAITRPNATSASAPIAQPARAPKPVPAASVSRPVAQAPARSTSTSAFDARPAAKPKALGLAPDRFAHLPRWDVTRALPAAERARLSQGEQQLISKVVAEVREAALTQGLNYVPVFGYLSLRHDNFRELGLASQAEVVPGKHTVEASLEGHALGVVASTIYRGTPEHPGLVAGLEPRADAKIPGTVLKLPLEHGEELLGKLFHREYFAEDDLVGAKPQAMYRPAVREVTLQTGETVKALVFITNPDSEKALEGLTPNQTAWLMGAQGGFRGPQGTLGGRSVDYWSKTLSSGAHGHLRESLDLAALVPSPETIDFLADNAATDPRARQALEVVLELFEGAYLPIALKQSQREDQSLERVSLRPPADVSAEVDRYLSLARA